MGNSEGADTSACLAWVCLGSAGKARLGKADGFNAPKAFSTCLMACLAFTSPTITMVALLGAYHLRYHARASSPVMWVKSSMEPMMGDLLPLVVKAVW